MRFFNKLQGWAIGEASGLYPSGVFITEDGGRNWVPLPAAATQGWLTADFVDANTGALAGRLGALAIVRRRALAPARNPGFGLRGLHEMRLDAHGRGWLVGDGGLVLQTTDLGLSWRLPEGGLPRWVNESFDFRSLAVVGDGCWIAGSPGTQVFHSADGGRTWNIQTTGQSLPIHAMHFLDPRRGWAVGALGTVLATNDGGQTWRRVHGGGTRAALLGFFGDADQAPLELLAQVAGNDGYLSVIYTPTRRDVEQGSLVRQTESQRLHEAVVRAGGSQVVSGWRFPLRQPGLELSTERLVQIWNESNDGQGLLKLEEILVRAIRVWRPEVVVTNASSPQGGDSLGHLMNQMTLRAVESAADGTRYPEHSVHLGLSPWKVKKLLGTLPAGEYGAINITTAQLAPRLGRSLADVASDARSLLTTNSGATPATLGLRLSINTLPQDIGQRDVMSGLSLAPGGEARRYVEEPSAGIDELQRMANRFRNAQAILDRSVSDGQAATRLLGQLSDLTRGLDSPLAGRVLFKMGQRYHRAGQWEAAAETFDSLVKRYPEHPLTPAALVWLVQYWSSGEATWRQRRQAQVEVQPLSAAAPPERPTGVVLATATVASNQKRQSLVADATGRNDRPAQAAEIGKLIEHTLPALYAEPEVRFPLAVAHVNQGFPRQAERFYLALRRTRPQDDWWRCATGERWLADRQGQPPKSTVKCRVGLTKPLLDGKLDDPQWKSAQRLQLKSARGDDAKWGAVAMTARDDEYLYLAVDCQRAPSVGYAPDKGSRPRDSDLTSRDRVDFLLDIDRDYTTFYRLTVDYRGFTAERCWDDATWNPQWFVAAGGDENTWTVEIAIPWQELAPRPPSAKTVWGIGVQRTVPGVGFQSWTQPAALDVVPAGFGYLLFD